MMPSIKPILKDNMARFSFYRTGNMFYTVDVEGQGYQFPVSLEGTGGAMLTAEFKAITLMQYTREALADGTIVQRTKFDCRGSSPSLLERFGMWQAGPV